MVGPMDDEKHVAVGGFGSVTALTKRPFRDALGRWFCYRNDALALDAGALPLGPFLTEEYAVETTEQAVLDEAPLKLFAAGRGTPASKPSKPLPVHPLPNQ